MIWFCLDYYRGHRRAVWTILRSSKAWFLVEVKLADTNLSPSLAYFQTQTKAAHAFQVVMYLPYERADCFKARQPSVVPASSFLAQLL